MAKGATETVHLVSSEGTGFFYSIRRKKGKEKLKVKKYDPIAKKHVLFEEKKISRLKKRYKPGAAKVEAAKADAPQAEAKPESKKAKTGKKGEAKAAA